MFLVLFLPNYITIISLIAYTMEWNSESYYHLLMIPKSHVHYKQKSVGTDHLINYPMGVGLTVFWIKYSLNCMSWNKEYWIKQILHIKLVRDYILSTNDVKMFLAYLLSQSYFIIMSASDYMLGRRIVFVLLSASAYAHACTQISHYTLNRLDSDLLCHYHSQKKINKWSEMVAMPPASISGF